MLHFSTLVRTQAPERNAMPRKGILFILVGPSGAGKNTLMKRVQQQFDNLPQLATMTTRSKREGEKNGREHWFISHAKFQELIDTNALIEWQRVHMNDLYGTPRRMVEDAINTGHDLIADIEFLGAAAIHEGYPDNTVLVFVTPSRLDILTDRILQRGNITPEVLANRLERARFEMTFAPR
jgi:guanylate kinase